MLIKPDLKDEEIIACLRDAYGLTIEKVVFDSDQKSSGVLST